MLPQHFDLLKGLVNTNYVEQAQQARNSRSKQVTTLLTTPGHVVQLLFSDCLVKSADDIQLLLEEMASFDTNNFQGNVGVGEREGRVISDLVRRRHFGLTHGIGRSGDVMAEQPKAAGSSLIVQLTKYLALDAIRLAGIKAVKACAVLPAATGLTMTLVFLALRQMRPQGRYVVWIDQKSCFKAIGAAGLEPIVVELKPIEGTDALGTDLEGMQAAIERVGADKVLCICTTTSTFAPRVPDFIDEVALVASKLDLRPHVINNAYGLQCSKCTHLIETGCRRGRVDAFVQSTDKNFMVPVGGAIVAGPSSALVDKVSSLYPGRASMGPVLDLFITLLSLGVSGWTGLLQERKDGIMLFRRIGFLSASTSPPWEGGNRRMDKNAASRTSCLALTWLQVLIHVAIWNSSASGSVPTQQPVRALQETPPAACSCGPLDAHWQQLREATWKAFTPDFAKRVLNYSDPVFFWIRNFPCPDLPATSPRGAAALSDCAPGVILLHVLCAQRKLLQLRFDEAQEQLVEALMALPFAEECCGHLVAEGKSKKGYAFKTCCRACATGKGHDDTCLGPAEVPEDEGSSRPRTKNVLDANPVFELSPELFDIEDGPPSCLAAPAELTKTNRDVGPIQWGMTYSQFMEFVEACTSTKCWKNAELNKDFVNLYDLNPLLIRWTRNTGAGIALRMNPAQPVDATLMVSHCWGESMNECSEALEEFKSRQSIEPTCGLWFCAFSQYQAGDELEDVGPTIAEQLRKDPFGTVVRAVANREGMVVVHTSKQEIYTRLWCVYEISEALAARTAVNIAYSMDYVSKHAANLDDMLRARTRDARCAKDSDETYIREKVEKSGGWSVLDRKIFSFRLDALRALVKKHRSTLAATLQHELQKVEGVELQECLAPREERVSSVVVRPHAVTEQSVSLQSSTDGGFLRKYCSFFADILSPPKNQACGRRQYRGGPPPPSTLLLEVQTNYVRFYRAVSYYIQSAELLDDLLWQPTRTCVGDEGCSDIPGHVCNKRLNRCIPIKDGCSADAEVCPPGRWCTSITSPGEDRCSLELSPICISNGELQAFHPGIDCLQRVDYPGMIKACSEMGTTLYPLNWSSSPSEHLLAGAQGREAMILPVTLRLRSPWHMLHSLVPAYAQSKTDGRYGLRQLGGDFDLLIVDQDLDKDRHIWEKVLGDGVSDTTMGGLDFLLRLISDQPYKLLKEVAGSCYRRVVWGHELMLYSGGGWTNEAHMSHFVRAARDFVQSEKFEDSVRESRLLLVERRNSSAWGRWIDNFDSVREASHEWVSSHPDLVSSLEVADLAELSWPDQLRLAARMRLMFGAHGDGLSWSVFMGEGSALVEAVPARDAGFQACVEGQDKNPYGIFGGIARLARVLHFCFLTNASETQAAASRSEEDLFQWGWRQLNLHINIDKLREYLSVAAAAWCLQPSPTIAKRCDGRAASPTRAQRVAAESGLSALEGFMAKAIVKKFLTRKEGSVLRAWVQRLDPECERQVSQQQFLRYLRDAKYPEDPTALFEGLDEDGGGELSLQDLDEEDGSLYWNFQEFCVLKFRKGVEDFMRSMGSSNAWEQIEDMKISFTQFREGLQSLGWEEGHEDRIFDALSFDQRFLIKTDMKWLDVECRRVARKEKARWLAVQEQRLRERRSKQRDPSETLLEFKNMLKRKYGTLIRAWRRALCQRDTMTLQRSQFLKACSELGWRKDVRGMWQKMDRDSNGCVTLEEFDYESAQVLAHFSKFVTDSFRSYEVAFTVLDADRNNYVPFEEFSTRLDQLGFKHSTADLFAALDLQNTGRLYQEDFRFLEKWRPRPFLTAEPNEEAAERVKARLLKKHVTFLRAWKTALDRTGNNRCSWDEFQSACKEVGWSEDVPGAWCALDKRKAGSLTLQDIDPSAGEALVSFRDWAVEQFGSVKTCFMVLDDDGSNEVTSFEFKQACRAYGYRGPAKLAFKALDTNGRGALCTDDVAFLDEWAGRPGKTTEDTEPEEPEALDEPPEASPRPTEAASGRFQAVGDLVLQSTENHQWPKGALHPAFRLWANSKRKTPIRTSKGSLPPLVAQVDFGDPHMARRPILLMAPVPVVRRTEEYPVETRKNPWRSQKKKPGLDTLLSPRRVDRAHKAGKSIS
eukprot:s2122_g32.t3